MADKASDAADGRRLLDRTFDVAIILKGLDGVIEIVGGILLFAVTPTALNHLAVRLTPEQAANVGENIKRPVRGVRCDTFNGIELGDHKIAPFFKGPGHTADALLWPGQGLNRRHLGKSRGPPEDR